MKTSDNSKQVILDRKIARIITILNNEHNLPIDEATELYYSSETSKLIEDGVADLHCRSDRYLADEVWIEKNKN